jgi:hypothetical protein
MEDNKKREFGKWVRLKEHAETEIEKKPEKYDGPNEMSLDGLIKFLMAGSSEEPKKNYIGQYD